MGSAISSTTHATAAPGRGGTPRHERLRALRRRVLVHRRPLAAVLAGVAVLLAVQAIRAPAPATVSVWTAARDLPAGAVLGSGDLRAEPFPPGSVPDRVIRDPSQVTGRTVAVPLRRGEPVTDVRLVTPGLLAGYPGTVATPVRLTDPAIADLLRAGDVVDLVAADPQGERSASTVASGAVVLAVPRGPGVDPGSGLPGRLVLFAVPTADATAVTGAAASDYLTVWLNR